MVRLRLVSALALVGMTALAGCSDQPSTVAPSVPGTASASISIQSVATIQELIDQLFSIDGHETAADSQFEAIQKALEDEDFQDAIAKAVDLVNFVGARLAEDQLEEMVIDPRDGTTVLTTEEAVALLTDELFELVGLQDADIDPELLSDIHSGEVDGVLATAEEGDGEDEVIVTQTEGNAGTIIQEGALDPGESILVLIHEVDIDDPNDPDQRCLPTELTQEEECYNFERFPAGEFNLPVERAVCLRSTNDLFAMHRFDESEEQVVRVPGTATDQRLIDAGFTCPEWSIGVAQGRSGLLGRLARLLIRPVDHWVRPPLLFAADKGLSGSDFAYSNHGWAIPRQLTIVAGDGVATVPNSLLPINPAVEVSSSHDDRSPEVLEGVEVTFDTGGDGVVREIGSETAGSQSVTVTTNSDGIAAVEWVSGSNTGAQTLQAEVGGADDSPVTFEATVVPVASLPVECLDGGGGDLIAGAANRAFYVPFYDDTDLDQVNLWFSADVGGTYTIELTAREDTYSGPLLGTEQATMTLAADRNTFTAATFDFGIDDGVTQASTVTFQMTVLSGPSGFDSVFFEVPDSFPGDPDCPVVETEDATSPLSTVRRQGVKVEIFGTPPIIE